jgi:hypothetical protein
MQLNAILILVALFLLHQASGVSFSYDSPNFIPQDFAAFGSGFVNGSGITLSKQGDTVGSLVFKNQSIPLANGFYTEFTLSITNCDNIAPYYGADGFTFFLSPEAQKPSYVPGGSTLGITQQKNVAALGFAPVPNALSLCAVNSTTTIAGGSSLVADTTNCIKNQTIANAIKNLRCNGPHTISVDFVSPASWKVVLDGTLSYSFTKDIMQILNWTSEYTGYLGFSGGVAVGYMNQQIINWTLSTHPGCSGSCAPEAQCNIFPNNTAACSCLNGYYGDGITCTPVRSNANIVPILECFEKYGDSNFEAFYGYRSLENETVVIPRGANNEFIGWEVTNNPIYFNPGRTPFYPSNAFSVEFEATDPITIAWRLANFEVSFMSNDTSRLCSQDLEILLRFRTGRELDANETSLIVGQLSNLLGISYGRLSVRNITYTTAIAKRDTTQLAELEIEISGTNSTTQNEPRASQVVQQFVNAATNSTLMNEVVNPDTENPDPAREFVDLKPVSSGTETLGQVLPTPIAPPSSSNSPSDPETPSKSPSSVPITSSATSTTLIGQMIGLIVLTCSLSVL